MANKILALILVFTLLIPLASACNDAEKTSIKATNQTTADNTEDKDKPKEFTVTEEFKGGKLSIDGVDISKYVIVIPKDAPIKYENFANDLSGWIRAVTKHELKIVEDSVAPVQYEIIVGSTNRPETAATVNGFSGQKGYKAVLQSGKLAINFRSTTSASISAFNALQRAFASNSCNITEGFTNNSLSLENIQDLVLGALWTEIKNDGLYVYKSTQTQADAWKQIMSSSNDWTQKNPWAPTGISLDFETDSSYVYLRLSKIKTGIVVLLNGKTFNTNWSGGYWEIPQNERGKVNRVTLLLSSVRDSFDWSIQALEIDGACKIEKHKTDLNMLFIGDSITEGYNCNNNTASTYTYYTSSYFNANAVVQGNGSGQCWPEIIDPAMAELFTPDVIIIAMGTNDYGANRSEDKAFFKDRMDAFLDKIESVYPGVPIIGVTPLRRLKTMNAVNPDSNYDLTCVNVASAGYEEAYADHGAIIVKGETLLKETAHYADVLHPNDEGFIVYGQNLCAAIKNDIEQIIKNK